MSSQLRIRAVFLCALWLSTATGQELGDEEAAAAYRRGHYLESYYLWKSLAGEGHLPSIFNLAVLYARGQGVSKDPKKAVALYTEAAEAGYAPAQFNLGMAYLSGEGVEQDFKVAAKWWLKAADQEHLPSVYNLARLFETGLGVERDPELARRLYRRAAALGDARAAEAAESVADERAKTVEDPEVKAPGEPRGKDWVMIQPDGNYTVQIFVSASDSDVEKFIGEHGFGDDSATFKVERTGADWFKAIFGSFETRREASEAQEELRRRLPDESPWLRRFLDVKNEISGGIVATEDGAGSGGGHALDDFAEGRDVGAALARGQYAFNRQQYDEALNVWRPLAEAGVAEAQYGIAFMYESGWSVDKDYALAFEWYEKAARQGHAKSQYNLGQLYLRGKGVARDEGRGLDWVGRAAAQDDQRALDFLANMAAAQR